MVEKIHPGVVVEGATYHPPGWMWVMSFAVNGCDWAIKECETEEFKNRAKMWFAERKKYFAERQLDHRLHQLDESWEYYEKTTDEIDRLRGDIAEETER